MRLNLKLLLWVLVIGTLCVSLTFWSKCNEIPENPLPRELTSSQLPRFVADSKVAHAHLNEFADTSLTDSIAYRDIECVINDEYTVTCRREGTEVYLPFSFVSKYFEVYGKIAEYEGVERFEWKHSYSRIYRPADKYTPQGIFMSFEHYNVEVRDRVKCISGIEGVPLSTQWGPEGYFYPIQIAQYGLSHYSKYLSNEKQTRILVDDASSNPPKWTVPNGKSSVNSVWSETRSSQVMEFSTPESLSEPGITMKLDITANFFISFDFKFTNNASVTVALEPKGKSPVPVYYIHYVCSSTLIQVDGNHVYYGIGNLKTWQRIYRDLQTDWFKGAKLNKKKSKGKSMALHRIVSVTIRGHGWIDNVTLASEAHLAQFYYSANWLIKNQDAQGGWPIHVTRSLANGALTLPPGWYSAMAQGQAMSLLARAYDRNGNRKYLDSALAATAIFDVPSANGGVLAKFLDKYNWYEEYPTTPSCYVLNGFIYSLIGLYDLKTVAPEGEGESAERLYNIGIETLKTLLPLFDTGSGSIYDLRHLSLRDVSLDVAPNLARWDYHATHINQLLLLSTIETDPIFERTAQRWIGYMKGKRAPHN